MHTCMHLSYMHIDTGHPRADMCRRIPHANAALCAWSPSVRRCSADPFLPNWVTAIGGDFLLQGAGKPGSGQRLGAARLLNLSSASRWAAPVSVGTKIPKRAGGGKRQEKEEVEGTPNAGSCRASLLRSVAFSLPP